MNYELSWALDLLRQTHIHAIGNARQSELFPPYPSKIMDLSDYYKMNDIFVRQLGGLQGSFMHICISQAFDSGGGPDAI